METIVKEQNTEVVKRSGIMFKLTSLLSFATISKPGKYLLKVFNNVSDANLIPATETANAHHIITLRAVSADKIAQIKETFKGKTEVEIEETNGLFMTANRWEGEALPMKGEAVECIVDYVDNQEKTERVLRITASRVVAARAADTFDLADFAEAPAPSSQSGAGQSNDLVTGKK